MKKKVEDRYAIYGGENDVILDEWAGALLMMYCSLTRQSSWDWVLCVLPMYSRRRPHLTYHLLEPHHRRLNQIEVEGRIGLPRLLIYSDIEILAIEKK